MFFDFLFDFRLIITPTTYDEKNEKIDGKNQKIDVLQSYFQLKLVDGRKRGIGDTKKAKFLVGFLSCPKYEM